MAGVELSATLTDHRIALKAPRHRPAPAPLEKGSQPPAAGTISVATEVVVVEVASLRRVARGMCRWTRLLVRGLAVAEVAVRTRVYGRNLLAMIRARHSYT